MCLHNTLAMERVIYDTVYIGLAVAASHVPTVLHYCDSEVQSILLLKTLEPCSSGAQRALMVHCHPEPGISPVFRISSLRSILVRVLGVPTLHDALNILRPPSGVRATNEVAFAPQATSFACTAFRNGSDQLFDDLIYCCTETLPDPAIAKNWPV